MAQDRVMVSRGFTRNLGEFQSARYDAWYETDVKDGESVDDAYARARDFVETKLTADIEADN